MGENEIRFQNYLEQAELLEQMKGDESKNKVRTVMNFISRDLAKMRAKIAELAKEEDQSKLDRFLDDVDEEWGRFVKETYLDIWKPKKVDRTKVAVPV